MAILQGDWLAFTVVQLRENSKEGWLFQPVLFLIEMKHNDLSRHRVKVVVVWGGTVSPFLEVCLRTAINYML